MHALLAIKPEFAEKILDGEKKYEFRRTSFQDSRDVELVFLYASSPVKQIVGFFTTDRVVEASPKELWEMYGEKSGIDTRKRFMDYFEGADTGFAIHIDQKHRFSKAIDPSDIFEEYSPPMSFHYLNNDQKKVLMDFVPEEFRDDTVATDLTRDFSN